MALTAGVTVGLSIAILGIGVAYGEMKYHFNKTLADEIRAEKYTLKNNQEAFQKLANADVPVYVARSSDPVARSFHAVIACIFKTRKAQT